MSYRCDLCRDAVPHNRGQLRHVVTRLKDGRREIDREYNVCQACKLMLDGGTPVYKLIQKRPSRDAASTLSRKSNIAPAQKSASTKTNDIASP